MGVCVQGEQGVTELLELLKEELRLAMALSGNANTNIHYGNAHLSATSSDHSVGAFVRLGCRSLSEVSRTLVRRADFTSKM